MVTPAYEIPSNLSSWDTASKSQVSKTDFYTYTRFETWTSFYKQRLLSVDGTQNMEIIFDKGILANLSRKANFL